MQRAEEVFTKGKAEGALVEQEQVTAVPRHRAEVPNKVHLTIRQHGEVRHSRQQASVFTVSTQ